MPNAAGPTGDDRTRSLPNRNLDVGHVDLAAQAILDFLSGRRLEEERQRLFEVEQFERLRGTAWDRLAAEMDAMSQEAAANGLTPAALESLLSDES